MSAVLTDRKVHDLIDQLDRAAEALSDTRGTILDDDDADSADIAVADDMEVAITALHAAASYLIELREADHD